MVGRYAPEKRSGSRWVGFVCFTGRFGDFVLSKMLLRPQDCLLDSIALHSGEFEQRKENKGPILVCSSFWVLEDSKRRSEERQMRVNSIQKALEGRRVKEVWTYHRRPTPCI